MEELQAAGVISSSIDTGPVRELVRVMLDDALTPRFQAMFSIACPAISMLWSTASHFSYPSI